MAQARVDYGKVVAPRPFGGAELAHHRLDIFKFLMICMILLTIVSVFHVWSRFKLVDLNLQISEASRLLKEAEQEQKRLKLEVSLPAEHRPALRPSPRVNSAWRCLPNSRSFSSNEG